MVNDSTQNVPKEKEPQKPEKCIKKFKTLTDTYYGVPNLFGPILLLYAGKGSHLSSIGPTGAKFEFLLTDDFGIGTDINYSTASAKWTEMKTDEANNSVIYDHKLSSTAFRSMLSLNFHFSVKKKVDWYTSFKGGYYKRSFSYTSNDPNAVMPKIDGIWTTNNWHAAMRWEIGCRLFLTKFLAMNFSFGLGGGPLVSSGVSSKF